MEPIKKTAIVKKVLKVKAMPDGPPPVDPPSETPPVDNEIQAVKKRGGDPANLAKGREALAAKWAKTREDKQRAVDEAVAKRVEQEMKKKEKLAKDFGLVEDEESEEEVVGVKKAKKAVAVAPKPKKKVVRYVEQSEEESEEEEIVYVPKKKTRAPAPVMTPRPQIIFY
jgi:hypothetical protein